METVRAEHSRITISTLLRGTTEQRQRRGCTEHSCTTHNVVCRDVARRGRGCLGINTEHSCVTHSIQQEVPD